MDDFLVEREGLVIEALAVIALAIILFVIPAKVENDALQDVLRTKFRIHQEDYNYLSMQYSLIKSAEQSLTQQKKPLLERQAKPLDCSFIETAKKQMKYGILRVEPVNRLFLLP